MSFIVAKDLYKSFSNAKVLNGMSFSIEKGEQVVIKGASGSGKSTLMYLMGGLDTPNSGSIDIDGVTVSNLNDEQMASFRNLSVGFVFQFHFLLPSMTCEDNIYLPARIAQKNIADIKDWVLSLAMKLGVEHCLKKSPFELSGGEQQRINIIRALSLRPKLLLCDEPTGNLDSQNSKIVMDLLKSLSKEINSTLIVVTHDVGISESFDRKITIEDGYIIS